ncbi:MAG: hypothetical protein MK135_03105 [Polyangiaceae bacterium]|nr:hypothetical protein [Polyangiaceae bacterium]
MGFISSLFLATVLASTSPDPAAADTRDLFERAAVQYDTSEYVGAVDIFTEAYRRSAQIQDPKLRARVQAAIFFNLARAHSKAYALDRKPEHLLQAVDLLEKYLAQTADLSNEEVARQFLEETQKELERLEQEKAKREDAAAAKAEKTAAEREKTRLAEESAANYRGLIVGGSVLMGLGVAGGGVAVAGVFVGTKAKKDYDAGPTRDERLAADKRVNTANVMLITGSVSAGVLITTGLIMTLTGVKKKKKSQFATAAPFFSPGGGGLVLSGEF